MVTIEEKISSFYKHETVGKEGRGERKKEGERKKVYLSTQGDSGAEMQTKSSWDPLNLAREALQE